MQYLKKLFLMILRENSVRAHVLTDKRKVGSKNKHFRITSSEDHRLRHTCSSVLHALITTVHFLFHSLNRIGSWNYKCVQKYGNMFELGLEVW